MAQPLTRTELLRTYREAAPRCEGILRALEEDLRRRLSVPALRAGLKSRLKSFPSYYRKYIHRVHDPESPEAELAMGDLIGIRVICPFLDDVAEVERLIRASYRVQAVRRRMEDAPPEDFGYRATHLLIRIPSRLGGSRRKGVPRYCEIQIRTTLQDAWAEVEHELVYKAGRTPLHETLKRKLSALNANLTLADIVFQEVRDYQRTLHSAMSLRREKFREGVRSKDLKPSRTREEPASRPPEQAGMNGIETLLLEGLQAHNARSYAKAIRIYTRILKLGPGETLLPVLHVHRGMAHFARSMYRKALDDFLAAIALDPKRAASYYYAGAVHERMGDEERAMAFFNRSLAEDPTLVDSLIGRARLRYCRGDRALALADCEEALALVPESKEALEWKRRIQRGQGRRRLGASSTDSRGRPRAKEARTPAPDSPRSSPRSRAKSHG